MEEAGVAFREEAGILAKQRSENEGAEEGLRRSTRDRVAIPGPVCLPSLTGSAGRIIRLVHGCAERGSKDVGGRDRLVDENLEFSAGRDRAGSCGYIREKDRTVRDISDIAR